MKLSVKLVPLEISVDEFARAEVIGSLIFDTTDTSKFGQAMLDIGVGNDLEMDGDGAGKLAKHKFRLYSILRIPEVVK